MSKTTKEQRQELRALAKATLPIRPIEPWKAVPKNIICDEPSYLELPAYSPAHHSSSYGEFRTEEVKYIAAAYPSQVLALLDDLDDAEAECERLRDTALAWQERHDALRRERDALLAADAQSAHFPSVCYALYERSSADAIVLREGLRIATEALERISERQAAPADEPDDSWEIADEALSAIAVHGDRKGNNNAGS